MKFAVILVPDFSLHALRRSEPALAGRPVALVAGEGRKAVLTEVSPEADDVTPGITAALAMARCPGIVLRPRDRSCEADSSRLLTAAAFTLSPRVEFTAEGMRTVDLQGADCRQTEATMRLRVQELTRLGLPAKAGTGDSPLLARYAARCAETVLIVRDSRAFLDDLPIALAEPTAAQAEVLHNWGLKTLGRLAALPKAEVGRRLGTDGVALWERAAGESTRVLRLFPSTRTFVAQWDYDPPIESLEPLLFKLRRYAECLAAELRTAGFVAESLTLTLTTEDETRHRRTFRLAESGTDIDTWLKVMLAHLETLRLPSPLCQVTFLAQPVRPQVRQDGLFDTGLRDPLAFWENLSRVAAMIGEGRVGTPVMADSWQPDGFILQRPAEAVPAPRPPPLHPAKGGVLRRFRPPLPVTVECQQHRPVRLQGSLTGTARAVGGPWRVSGHWWRPDAWAVEIWHVQLEHGCYQLARHDREWAVEGEID